MDAHLLFDVPESAEARDGKPGLALHGVVYELDDGVFCDTCDRRCSGVRLFISILFGVHSRMMVYLREKP